MKHTYFTPNFKCIAHLMDLKIGWLITSLKTFSNARNEGLAQQVLGTIIGDADREMKVLYLSACPDPGTDFGRLVAWYKKNGFEQFIPDVDPCAMMRRPGGISEWLSG